MGMTQWRLSIPLKIQLRYYTKKERKKGKQNRKTTKKQKNNNRLPTPGIRGGRRLWDNGKV